MCHHCCRRIPRDHARKRAQGTTVLTAFDLPMPLVFKVHRRVWRAKLLPLVRDSYRLYLTVRAFFFEFRKLQPIEILALM